MPENNKDSRVLSRFGARELSQEECDSVEGGFRVMAACTFDPITGCYDHPCSVCPG